MYVLKIQGLYLNGTTDSEINSVTVVNSTIGFMKLTAIEGTSLSPRILKLSNLNCKDSLYENPLNIIEIEGILTTENFQIQIIQSSFQNLKFILGGNLILMKSQMINYLLLQDSSFESISGGSISIESFDKLNTAVTSHLRIQNLTTLDINSQFSSFLQVSKEGELSIYDSTIKNIY